MPGCDVDHVHRRRCGTPAVSYIERPVNARSCAGSSSIGTRSLRRFPLMDDQRLLGASTLYDSRKGGSRCLDGALQWGSITVPVSDSKRKKLLADVQPVLNAGEQVLDCTSCQAEVRRMGAMTKRNATIAVTDRRVVIFSKKLGGYDVQDFAYGLLTGVNHKKGFTFGNMDFRASGDSAHLTMVPKDEVERIAQLVRDRIALSHRPDGPGATVPSVGQSNGAVEPSTLSVADEIRKLGELRDAGLLSQEEFDTQKTRLLA